MANKNFGACALAALAALALTAVGCQSPPTPVVATTASTTPQARSSTVAQQAASRPTLRLGVVTVAQPEVWPSTPSETDALCSYLREQATPAKGPRTAEQFVECKRSQLAALNDRRLQCLKSGNALPPKDRASAVAGCMGKGLSFAQSLQDRKDFDTLASLQSLPDLAALGKRLATTTDRVGLLPEIRIRMNALCARSQPQFVSTAEWQVALNHYDVAGPGGSCAEHAQTARTALLNIEKSEEQAALTEATTWKAVSAFIARFEQRDVAELLPAARQKLAEARSLEIAQMQAMPLDLLETFWSEGTQLTSELKDLARTRLVDDSIAEKTFAGALRAYRVTNDVSHVANSQRLAVTPTDRRKLEEIAVANTATPGRFFRLGFTASHGEPRRDEDTHMGLFALYTMHGLIPVEGRVSVERARDAPSPLVHGQYRVLIDAEMTLHKGYSRQSRVLGNDDSFRDETIKKRIVVTVGAPAMSGNAAVNFGDIPAVWMKRGSSGGIEQEWVDADPVIRLSVVGVEVQ